MSRYVRVDLPLEDRAEVCAALEALGFAHAVAGPEGLLLDGSLECAGEPVDVRVPPEAAETVQDWGFVVEAGRLRLVCADVDRARLERETIPALVAEVARARLAAAGHAPRIEVDADGTRRVVVDVDEP